MPADVSAPAARGARSAFAALQRAGNALSLPVAALPVAGLLLGLRAAALPWIPAAVAATMHGAGGQIFGSIPLLFAIAVALGFTENDGNAAVAAVIGYVVMVGTMGVLGESGHLHTAPFVDSAVRGGFGGMLAGGLAAALFRRFHRLALPPHLAFFAGKRFVFIATALGAVVLGAVLSVPWPPLAVAATATSRWAASQDPRAAATLYGLVERLLVPLGLHHIWNAYFFFEIGSFTEATGRVIHGDLQRYFSGDPSAGIFAGSFLFKMWGLPGAALAIVHAARPEQRSRIRRLMLSAALTSFVTGITEPIEFAFVFASPSLYVAHSLLAASGQYLMASLGVHMGFTFSQGAIDFVLFNVLNPFSQRWWVVLLLGPAYAAVYYGIFRCAIGWLDLKTPGRVPLTEAVSPSLAAHDRLSRAAELVRALGGRRNLKTVDACITRLRVFVKDPTRVQKRGLMALGAAGSIVIGHGVQVVFGPLSDNLKADVDEYLRSAGPDPEWPAGPPGGEAARSTPVPARTLIDPALLWTALGGAVNVVRLERLALTRLRVELDSEAGFDPEMARRAGVLGVMYPAPGVLHLIVGDQAERLALVMERS